MKKIEKIQKQIQEVAKYEFSSEEAIIKKGLRIFMLYSARENYQEYLEEHSLEEVIEFAMNKLDMTKEEVLFLAQDTYNAIVLDVPKSERLQDLEIGEYCYVFVPSSGYYRKEYKQISHAEVMEQNRIKLIAEQEQMLDNAIAKANEVLDAKNKEVNEANKEVDRISNELSKLNAKLVLLKGKNIVTMKPSERAKNRNEIASIEGKSAILLKDLQDAKEELTRRKNERFYINEDILDLEHILENPDAEGYYDVSKIKDTYRGVK